MLKDWDKFRMELLLTILVFELWLCIFLIFLTMDRIFCLKEKKEEEQPRSRLPLQQVTGRC